MLSRIARFAGPKLAAFGSQLGRNYQRVYAPGGKFQPGLLAESLLPDVFYGGLAAMNTPGDLGDKGIAFVTDMALGGLSSGAVRGAAGLRSRGIQDKTGKIADSWRDQVGNLVEMSVPAVTMQYAHPLTNAAIRVKHGGKSPFDLQVEQQEQAYRAEVAQQLMQELAAKGMLR